MFIAVLGLFLVILPVLLRLGAADPVTRAKVEKAANVMRGLGILLIVVGILIASIVLVPAGYRGVLLRFGAVQGQLGEGIHLIVPAVNAVIPVEVRTQKEVSSASAASKDLQTVRTDLALNFRVDPAEAASLFREVGTEYRSRVIDPAVQESIKVVTARYAAEELIRMRGKVKQEVETEITTRLKAYHVIVDPSGLSITNFDFSPEFNKAIEQKQVAQQNAEQQKYVLQQAELERQTEITRALGRSQAAKLNAAALQVQGGEKVIAREWIEKWDGKLPTVNSGANGNGVILDLSQIMNK